MSDDLAGVYRLECLDCGATVIGDAGTDLTDDQRWHRDHWCPDAEFQVTTDE
jgi:hypothetical protein